MGELPLDSNVAGDLKLFVVLSRSLQSVLRRLGPLVRARGFTLSQFEVMEMLLRKGPLTVNEIIEKKMSSSGNIGVVVENLEKLGWVRKEVGTEDRRVRVVTLTDEGRSRIDGCFPEHALEIAELFAHLEPKEKETLRSLLKKLGKGI